MLVFRSISRNDREILGNHAENPGPEGRRVFPLRFFPKLVDLVIVSARAQNRPIIMNTENHMIVSGS